MVLSRDLSCSEGLLRNGVLVTIMRYCLTMKRLPLFIFVSFLGAFVSAEDAAHHILAEKTAALPMPLSNNAVTTVTREDRQYVVSFAGLGQGRGHEDTLSVTLVLDSASGRWRESAPLPGGGGGLALIPL